MKIGVITDIHSNIDALKEVLKEFDKIRIDKIICCGDIMGIGLNPEEAVQELMKRKDMLIAVRGNHEKYLLEGIPKEKHDEKIKLSEEEINHHKNNHSKLSKSSREFLKELPLFQDIQIENKKIHIVHYAGGENGTYKKHIQNPTLEENKYMFEGICADIFLFGHTHTTTINRDGDKWYINPGSLGCPMSANNIAKAGILNIEENDVNFECLNVEYDVEKVIKNIQSAKYPHYKKILKQFYGKTI